MFFVIHKRHCSTYKLSHFEPMDVNKHAVIDTERYWAPEVNKRSDSSNDKPLLDWKECLSVSLNPFL